MRPLLRLCLLFAASSPWLGSPALLAEDWPQWLGPQRDGVWLETGIVETFPPSGPPVRWRVNIGAGYAGPAVAQGRVYITDHLPVKGASTPKSAFERAEIPGSERVLCLNEADG